MISYEHLRYGLALSGGAARAAAHLGVLKAMDEQHISPEIIGATSAGAVVACFYADGFDPEEVLQIIEKESLFMKIEPMWPRKAILKFDKVFRFFSRYIKTKNIEDLSLPVFIGVTDFMKGKLKYLTSGPLMQALKATSAVPGFFRPVEMDGSFYYDGGLISNLPVEPLENRCERIIGCNVNPLRPVDHIDGLLKIIVRTMLIGVNANMQSNIAKCDIYLEPENLVKYSLTDGSHYREMYEIGYKKATEVFTTHQFQ